MPDLDHPRIEAFGMLIEAHAELRHAVERDAQAAGGVPELWLSVLIRLRRSPGGAKRMTELARDMTISTSGLTRLVDRIERAGYVERRPCENDRRGLLAVLTPAGEDVLARFLPVHLASLERWLSGALDDAELARLTVLLRKVRNHVRHLGPEPSAECPGT